MLSNTNIYRRAAWAVVILAAMAIGTAVAAQGRVVQRPISDFVTQQGSTSVFFAPCPDEAGWWNERDMFGWFDYAGISARCHGLDIGTAMDGTITERPLSDGRVEVKVILQTTNALTWAAFDWDPGRPTLFGARPDQLVLDPALPYALGDCYLQVVFRNPSPGFPMPDLVKLAGNVDYPERPAGQELVSTYFRGTATGPLHAAFGVPEGSTGRLVVSQTGFYDRGPGSPADPNDQWGFWTAEVVNLRRIGN